MDAVTKLKRTRRWTAAALVAVVMLAGASLWLRPSASSHRHEETPIDDPAVRVRVQSTQEVVRTPDEPTLPRANSGSSDGYRVHLIVNDEMDAPVGGARIWLWTTNKAPQTLGITNMTGETDFEIECEQASESNLVVEREGLVPASLIVSEALEKSEATDAGGRRVRLTIKLESGAVLRGRLIPPSGATLPGSAKVHISQTLSSWPEGVLALSLHAGPRSTTVEVSADGSFKSDQLRAGSKYRLVAAAPGWVSRGDPVEAVPGAGVIEMPIEPVYILDVRLVDESGMTVRAPTNSYPWPGPNLNLWGVREQLREVVESPSSAMAGISPECRGETTLTISRYTRLFTSSSAAERLGPVLFAVSVPGYEPAKAQVFAIRADSKPEPQTLVMRPLGNLETGDIQFRLKLGGAYDALLSPSVDRRSEDSVPFLVIRLMPDPPGADGVSMIQACIWRPSRSPLHVEGVPVGRYRVALESQLPLGVAAQPRESVEVTTGEARIIEVELPDWGAIEAQVTDSAGQPCSGATSLELMRADGPPSDDSWEIGLGANSRRCVGVRAGQYRVSVRCGTSVTQVETVAVSAGAISQVSLKLP